MAYFTSAFVDFLGQLARNNTRAFYHANKPAYERHVKRPFEDFVEEMIHRVGALDPAVRSLTPKECTFRLARDTRFSKDKTPFKTSVSAVIARGGKKGREAPGLYFHLGATGAGIASGMYEPTKEELHKIRAAIHENGRTLVRLLKARAFTDLFGGTFRGAQHKRLPREFAGDVEQYPFIANKQFYFYAEYDDPAIALRDDLAGFFMKHYRAGIKVNAFLLDAVS